jgi:hypothetical protein
MRFSGSVLRQSGTSRPTELSQAEVRASVDRNGDGAIGAGESVTVHTDADGKYALDVAVKAGDTVVVRFAKSGVASVHRTIQGAPSGNMILSMTLKEMETLSCTGSSCTGQSGLVMSGLPAGTAGRARVFNPVTDTDAFPGSFQDSTGKLLESGVFATFALEDQLGDPLEALATPATVKMRIPRDTWPVVKDIAGGNGRIDVPLYAFDEVKGTWVREGEGFLEDGGGAVVPETALASIKEGSYPGTLFAVGQLSHFSSWNVDWPVESHGRIGGEVGECWWNGERKPCAGATVTASGASYTGTSTPQTVGADGSFSIDVMRSEAPGEDLDGDGVTGETTTVRIRVAWDGRVYDVGTKDMPATQATEGGGDTYDAGTITLDDANLLEAGLCTVAGHVSWADGSPAEGAFVFSWDDEVPSELVDALCFTGTQFLCTIMAATDPEGAFSVVAPAMGGLTTSAFAIRQVGGDPNVTEWGYGERTFASCPDLPISLSMDQGWIAVTPTVAWNGTQISWTPAGYGALLLEVYSPTAGLKWAVEAQAGAIGSPVTYGLVPAGATQLWPDAGSPGAIETGDVIWISISGTATNGIAYWGFGELVVP